MFGQSIKDLCASSTAVLAESTSRNLSEGTHERSIHLNPVSFSDRLAELQVSHQDAQNTHPLTKTLSDAEEGTGTAASVDAASRANEISEAALRLNREGFWLVCITLIATAVAAYANYRSARIAQNLIDGTNRPYLTVQLTSLNFAADSVPQGYLAVQYQIKNIGGSAAIIDTFHHTLEFSEPKKSKSMREWLGGSNIYVIEKDAAQQLTVSAKVSAEEFRRRVTTDHEMLIWRVNFSYTDLFRKRRNYFFEQYYQAPPFDVFRSNFAARVEEVSLDPHKWHRLRSQFSAIKYRLKAALSPRTRPKDKSLG